jgi:hypothetical protein
VKCSGFGHGGHSLALLLAGWGSHFLCLSLGGGKIHHQDPLHLKCGLIPRRRMWLDRGGGMLTGELALSWHCLLLSCGMSSTSLDLLPSVTSMASLDREVGFRPWCHRPQGNHHHGLCGYSILHPWCGCGESERAPHAAPSGGREAEASFPGRCHEELLGGVLDHGPPWSRCPAVS